MSTESTDPTQQSNPGEGGTEVAANPEGTAATEQQGTEGQGDGNTAAATGTEATGDGQESTEPEGAPEQYETFTLPEGFALEGARLEQATEFFKANGWTQAQAQQAVDLYTRLAGEDAASMTTALESARAQQREAWGEQAKTELGGNYDAAVASAYLAVQSLPNKEALAEAFNAEGWGNHPELIKAFAHVGKMLSEGGMDTGKQGATQQPKSLAERMYGETSKT